MAAVAGWYPDPEGDTTRLRYWDGTQWTNDYTAVPTQAAANEQAAQATAAGAQAAQGTPVDQAAQANASYAQNAQATTGYAQPMGAAPVTSNMQYQVFDPEQIYPMTNQDRTLRLIAFILNIISCIGYCWLIFPLAWMIPMTVMSWNVYKGKRANTVAYGVCTLIFLNLVSGILLLVSNKDIPQQ